MAFSIDWFTTVPGILVSIGVVLLIVALIMFITSSMKEKKATTPSVLENNDVNDTPVEEVVEEPVSVETPLIDTVSEEVVVPSFEGDNIIPTVDEQEVSENEVNDVVENNFIPADLEEVVVPTEEENSFEIPEPIAMTDDDVEHRPIYGGADPLEATQTLPKMDVHHEPYSGGTIEVDVVPEVENVEETVAVADEEETPSIIAIPDEDEIEEL